MESQQRRSPSSKLTAAPQRSGAKRAPRSRSASHRNGGSPPLEQVPSPPDAENAQARAERGRREEDQRWRASITRARTLRGTSLVVALIFIGLACVVRFLWPDMGLTRQAGLLLTVGLGVGAAVSLGGAVFMPRYVVLRREEREREKELRNEVDQAAAEIRDAESFTDLVKANTKNLSTYTALARGQAAVAFRNSQIAMGIGLVVLFVGAVAAMTATGAITKVATASLTAVGGGFAGYIARTFIRSYNAAIAQLNFAFQQPLVNSDLLASERLANQMSTPAAKDKALDRVIEKVVTIILRVVPETTGADRAPRRSRSSSRQ